MPHFEKSEPGRTWPFDTPLSLNNGYVIDRICSLNYLNQHYVKAFIWPDIKISEKFIFTVQIYVCSNKPRSSNRLYCIFSFDVLLLSNSVKTNIDILIHLRTVGIAACFSIHFLIFNFIPDVVSRYLARGDWAKLHLALINKLLFLN